jgi:ferredoxin/flavodoxin---NADP+ reductase
VSGLAKFVEGKVVGVRRWTDRLFSIMVDAPVEPYQAGQFGKLVLEIDGEVVARPYSYVNAPQERPLEFYYITVDGGPLTERLIGLVPGNTIYLAPKAAGFLILSELPPAENLWLLSTGTALGPFLAILKTPDPWSRFKDIALIHAVRHTHELTYRDQIDKLLAEHPGQLRYMPFVSREATDFALSGRVPDAIRDGRLQAKAGMELAPEKSQIMICGNPDMVKDTTDTLLAMGFRKNRRKEPGHITVENYW